MSDDRQREGVVAGVAAYGVWGLFPLYFHHLEPASALEILCHRILWSLVVTAMLLAATRWRRRGASPRAAAPRDRRLVGLVALAALCIALNWFLYTWAVTHDHVVEAALGYFINPLVTVGLGVGVLGERLRRGQWIAVGFGAVAVAVLTAAYGHPPWISLALACSFASYGYLKKRIQLDPIESLLGETLVLAPIALIVVVAMQVNGSAHFGGPIHRVTILLVLAGPVTTVPLLLFATAARRIPLTLLGLLQYLTPIGQFLCGVLVFDEHLTPARWIGFALVWAALLVLSTDALRTGRNPDANVAVLGEAA